MISFHKIANLNIDFGLNYGPQSSSNKKDASVNKSLLPVA